MNRRQLLQVLPGLAALTSTAVLATPIPSQPLLRSNGWRTFEVTTQVEMTAPGSDARVWVPLPLSQDTDYFRTLHVETNGNYQHAHVGLDSVYRNAVAAAIFRTGEQAPRFTVVTRFATKERNVPLTAGSGMTATREELALAVKSTSLIPTDGIVRKTALQITQGATTEVERARAIYNWIVDNTVRDPKTRGCGVGDIKAMLEADALSGKCADLNTLFVGLCRAVGIPARDVYGIRVAESPRGYRSMGRLGDITKAQHCRAEFYAQGIGWVPVDPADVRKVVLEERPGLTLQDELVRNMRQFLFGNWEGNWLAYNYAHDVTLVGSAHASLPFLMYPQAETADGRLDSLDPDNFKYKITSREISA